jgi:hypothetical protein
MPGSFNNIDVLQRASLFAKLAMGEKPPVEFIANGRYYLADDIYPKWVTFVKSLAKSQGNKDLNFHYAQVAVRTDVERAFGFWKPNLLL